jgi:nitric oxide synthase-interacting protein
MTRHGLNCTNSAVYSYAERKKDQKAAGYGAERIRLGKDAVKGFDCCSLTLQPTSRPVISPQGWIFDKEAIFKFILDKKKEYEKKMAEYDRQKDSEMEEFRDIAAAEKEELKKRFEQTEKSIVTKRLETAKKSEGANISNMTEDRKRVLPAFWLPSCGPQAKKSRVEKPDKTVYCPMSRKPIRVKDLVDVQWTVARDPDDKRSLIAREERYQCAVTGDVLNNSSHCAVLRPTGHVVTVHCVDKIIKKDWQHPLTGQSLKEKDIIYIQRGATGFSSANSELMAERDRPAMSVA